MVERGEDRVWFGFSLLMGEKGRGGGENFLFLDFGGSVAWRSVIDCDWDLFFAVYIHPSTHASIQRGVKESKRAPKTGEHRCRSRGGSPSCRGRSGARATCAARPGVPSSAPAAWSRRSSAGAADRSVCDGISLCLSVDLRIEDGRGGLRWLFGGRRVGCRLGRWASRLLLSGV